MSDKKVKLTSRGLFAIKLEKEKESVRDEYVGKVAKIQGRKDKTP